MILLCCCCILEYFMAILVAPHSVAADRQDCRPRFNRNMSTAICASSTRITRRRGSSTLCVRACVRVSLCGCMHTHVTRTMHVCMNMRAYVQTCAHPHRRARARAQERARARAVTLRCRARSANRRWSAISARCKSLRSLPSSSHCYKPRRRAVPSRWATSSARRAWCVVWAMSLRH